MRWVALYFFAISIQQETSNSWTARVFRCEFSTLFSDESSWTVDGESGDLTDS